MLRALVLGSAVLFTLPTFAAVVCTQPAMGTLTIKQNDNDCAVKLVMNEGPRAQTWYSVNNRCTEVYNGETYQMSSVLQSNTSPVQPTIVITRGVSTDIKSVKLVVTSDVSMLFAQDFSCTTK